MYLRTGVGQVGVVDFDERAVGKVDSGRIEVVEDLINDVIKVFVVLSVIQIKRAVAPSKSRAAVTREGWQSHVGEILRILRNDCEVSERRAGCEILSVRSAAQT